MRRQRPGYEERIDDGPAWSPLATAEPRRDHDAVQQSDKE